MSRRARRIERFAGPAVRSELFSPVPQQRRDKLKIVGDPVLQLPEQRVRTLARFGKGMNREIEAPDDIKFECCRQHEDQHRNPMGRRKYERAIRRIEHYPRDERGHGGEPQTDANAAEQACQQDRREERHGTEALAHPA